jgi:hypothetical protein
LLMHLEMRLDWVTLRGKRMLFWFFMLNIVDEPALGSLASCKNKSLRSKNIMPK